MRSLEARILLGAANIIEVTGLEECPLCKTRSCVVGAVYESARVLAERPSSEAVRAAANIQRGEADPMVMVASLRKAAERFA